jgi:hypothetical protein
MPKPFYKHKTLLDEQLLHRRMYPLLNERFDVKHVRDDLHLAGIPDPQVHELAVKQGRILLTTNVKHFRPLLREDGPGIIGIPGAWLPDRIDTKLTALLMRHGPNYFRGRYRSLAAEERQVKPHKRHLRKSPVARVSSAPAARSAVPGRPCKGPWQTSSTSPSLRD